MFGWEQRGEEEEDSSSTLVFLQNGAVTILLTVLHNPISALCWEEEPLTCVVIAWAAMTLAKNVSIRIFPQSINHLFITCLCSSSNLRITPRSLLLCETGQVSFYVMVFPGSMITYRYPIFPAGWWNFPQLLYLEGPRSSSCCCYSDSSSLAR